ncbi:probable LRR receptor-like serine/threonine-protein kinase At3g47570 [Vicia villosa]|uniref:probable LRR receptor-like serine/threonine-protein kinase At3g47570 n=1 Tax=Vicia villosa TaxID=3911 RepID=UPI00273C5307|nr:probable LRR receptor-like serine/threonine-protein kinase At3g47570 [Vicia villosa]
MLDLVFKSILKEKKEPCFCIPQISLSNTLLLLNQMKPYIFLLPMSWYFYFHFFTLTVMYLDSNKTVTMALGNQTDHLALLQFKHLISSDPYGILDSWNSSTHFCKWNGIMCSPKHQRVTTLMLQGYNLHGSISPYIGNLSHIRFLNLGNNSFNGNIPQEFGRLSRLRFLLLANNSLAGEFPINLTKCYELKSLVLRGNNLIGKIPSQIGSLQKLQNILIDKNNFSGKIPPSVRNLSSVILFGTGYNNLKGNLPQELCYLKHLKFLSMHANKLSGTLPSCLYNMSSLTLISAAVNNFTGSLPSNMFHTLPNLKSFGIAKNQISGLIPISISNASTLTVFDISKNHFVGQVPTLGKIQGLRFLNLALNNIGDNSTKDLEFLNSLTNSSNLETLIVSYNNFGGSLEKSIGNLSTVLSRFVIGGNQIYGRIPIELGNLISLSLLAMENNHLEGTIPTTFGKFQKIQLLSLAGNRLSGDIPVFIGNLSQLYQLELEENMLEGYIPPSIGNCQMLQYLTLSQNNLTGVIPSEIFSIPSLTNLLNLSLNSLSGSLPKEVGMLKNINDLDVSMNHLSGDIPETIGQCSSLENLRLQGNSFNGTIPSSLASLKGLRYLDLSSNQLYGAIPEVMQNISGLEYLNVSFNMLEGEVPTDGVFGNATQIALIGNIKLCGGISKLHLPPCPIKSEKHTKHHKLRLVAVIVSVVSFLILSFIITIYFMKKRNKKQPSDSPTTDHQAKVSYQELYQGTDGFSTKNLVGSGSFGSVYKGNLVSEDNVVAVKVLNLQKKGAHKSFIVECNALKNIRHRNLVKILTCCSGTDYKNQEFKALVFDYMKNGSLEQWLHPEILNAEHPITLDLGHRLNIIIDVASALHYLHQECEQLVLHCDLKPSNVLLDDDMVAHVGDFGIAKLVSTIDGKSHSNTSTIGIKGTIGYAPPEYGMGSEASTCGDMYSFGILVLEMLTGRRPTDEVLEDGQNLHEFVAISFPDNLIKVLDKNLVSRDAEVETQDRNHDNLLQTLDGCLFSLFRIGLICSRESPKERMSIVEVTRELSIIKKAFFNGVDTHNQV